MADIVEHQQKIDAKEFAAAVNETKQRRSMHSSKTTSFNIRNVATILKAECQFERDYLSWQIAAICAM